MILFKFLAFPSEGFQRAESAAVLKQRFSAGLGGGWQSEYQCCQI